MDYGSSELVLTMIKAMAIGLAAGYLIWGWKRPEGSSEGSGFWARIGLGKADPTKVATPSKVATEAKAPPKAPTPAPDAGAEGDGPVSEPEPTPPATLFTSAPDQVDDLQKIKGIGPKMEAVLNEKGVYQYSQLAAFTAEDLRWLDKATGSFPGRAERDEWVAQASQLQAEKTG